jgi:DnaJ-class molecular chaperone
MGYFICDKGHINQGVLIRRCATCDGRLQASPGIDALCAQLVEGPKVCSACSGKGWWCGIACDHCDGSGREPVVVGYEGLNEEE